MKFAPPQDRGAPDRTKGGSTAPGKVPATIAGHLRILVLGEPGIVREGLCALLAGRTEFVVVATESDPEDAVRTAVRARADIAILDFAQWPHHGVKTLAALKRKCPQARVLVLSSRTDARTIEAALRAGADGYLLKSDGGDELFSALRRIGQGESYLSASLDADFIAPTAPAPQPLAGGATAPAELTSRERQVIRLIAAGHRTREIAQLLSLSHKTIEKHRSTLMRKLGLRNASAVAAYATAHGYVDS